MFRIVYETLYRLDKAMELLHQLLEEEFSLLKKRNAEAIMSLEFSIHELLRQLAVEKECLKRFLGNGKVKDYALMLPNEEKKYVLEILQDIDDKEQICAKQASRNTQLSLGLLDQSKELLDFLHKRIVPPQKNTYGKLGSYVEHRPGPALIAGKF